MPPPSIGDHLKRLTRFLLLRSAAALLVFVGFLLLAWLGGAAREIVDSSTAPVAVPDDVVVVAVDKATGRAAIAAPLLLGYALVICLLPRGQLPLSILAGAGALALGYFAQSLGGPPEPFAFAVAAPDWFAPATRLLALGGSAPAAVFLWPLTSYVLFRNAARLTQRGPRLLPRRTPHPEQFQACGTLRRLSAIPGIFAILTALLWTAAVLSPDRSSSPDSGADAAIRHADALPFLAAIAAAICLARNIGTPRPLLLAMAAVAGYGYWPQNQGKPASTLPDAGTALPVDSSTIPPWAKLHTPLADQLVLLGQWWDPHAPWAAVTLSPALILLGCYITTWWMRWPHPSGLLIETLR